MHVLCVCLLHSCVAGLLHVARRLRERLLSLHQYARCSWAGHEGAVSQEERSNREAIRDPGGARRGRECSELCPSIAALPPCTSSPAFASLSVVVLLFARSVSSLAPSCILASAAAPSSRVHKEEGVVDGCSIQEISKETRVPMTSCQQGLYPAEGCVRRGWRGSFALHTLMQSFL
jgi:hypothetical protein